jgi:hypothetical protein
MTAGATQHLIGHCCLCEHAARAHTADGCTIPDCACGLSDAQVRFVEQLQQDRLASSLDFAFGESENFRSG